MLQTTQPTRGGAVTAVWQTLCKLYRPLPPPAMGARLPFTTINIHTLIRKLLQTNIPGTIIKFIANYITGRKAYTTYRNHTYRQRQFKTGVPQGGILSPTLFNSYISDLPPPSAPVQFMAYVDDITITSTHTRTSAAKKYMQPYIHKVFAWTKQNNVILNPGKTTCTLFTPHPAEYTSNLDRKIHNNALPMATHPKVLGLTLDPKLTYSNQSPFLKSYLHKVNAKSHPSPLCPLCNTYTHDTHHLFNCTHIRTTPLPLDLWTDPAGVMELLARWRDMLAGGPKAGWSDSPPHKQGSREWVDTTK